MKRCNVSGCNRKHRCKGFCGMHYQRVLHGKDIGTSAPYRGTGKYIDDKIIYRAIVEKAIGKSLPSGAVVHHVNGDSSDNRNTNLVVCQDQSYHVLVHQRQRAHDACGHADWLICLFCKKYDKPENLYVRPNRRQGVHRSCQAKHARGFRNG